MANLPCMHVQLCMHACGPYGCLLCAGMRRQTGICHAELQEYEAAEACFAKAQEHCSALDDPSAVSEQAFEATEAYFDVLVDRAKNAWHLQQRARWSPSLSHLHLNL